MDGWMGWDGMGWDGMEWNGMEWDGWMDGWMDRRMPGFLDEMMFSVPQKFMVDLLAKAKCIPAS